MMIVNIIIMIFRIVIYIIIIVMMGLTMTIVIVTIFIIIIIILIITYSKYKVKWVLSTFQAKPTGTINTGFLSATNNGPRMKKILQWIK